MKSAVKISCIVGLVLAAGLLGQVWIGFVAAGLAGYWISSGADSRPQTGASVSEDSASVSAIAVFSLGANDFEVARRLRSIAGLTIAEAEALLSTSPEDLSANPARFEFAHVAEARHCQQELKRLGAGVNLVAP